MSGRPVPSRCRRFDRPKHARCRVAESWRLVGVVPLGLGLPRGSALRFVEALMHLGIRRSTGMEGRLISRADFYWPSQIAAYRNRWSETRYRPRRDCADCHRNPRGRRRRCLPVVAGWHRIFLLADNPRRVLSGEGAQGRQRDLPASDAGGVIVHPDIKEVIPLAPEPIQRPDGNNKNDCERNAASGLLPKIRRQHPHLEFIVIEDGLASNGPHTSTICWTTGCTSFWA